VPLTFNAIMHYRVVPDPQMSGVWNVHTDAYYYAIGDANAKCTRAHHAPRTVMACLHCGRMQRGFVAKLMRRYPT